MSKDRKQTTRSTNARIFSVVVVCSFASAAFGNAVSPGGGGADRWSWGVGSWGVGKCVRDGSVQMRGSGLQTKEARKISHYSRIRISLPAVVEIVQGSAESVTIFGDDNLLPLVKTFVKDDELVIAGDECTALAPSTPIKIVLTASALSRIQLDGGGSIYGSTLQADHLEINAQGSAKVNFKSLRANQLRVNAKDASGVVVADMECESVEIDARTSGLISMEAMRAQRIRLIADGSGDVQMSGTADFADLENHNSGEIRARTLTVREAKVITHATGSAEVHATDILVADVRGAGGIFFAGKPSKISQAIRPVGKVQPL